METDERHTLTTEEIALLRAVARWRRVNGVSYFQWRPGKGFGAFTEWKLNKHDDTKRYDTRRINVTYEPGSDSRFPRLLVTRDYWGGEEFRELPVTTVREAVDVLVALGFLPVRFSSAYSEGWNVGREDVEHPVASGAPFAAILPAVS